MRSGWGAHNVSEVMANLALLCPLCNRVPQPPRSVALRRLPWIPACAGMTEGVHFARGTSWGAQWGFAPLRFFLSPKIGGQGVEMLVTQSVDGAQSSGSVQTPSARRRTGAAA